MIGASLFSGIGAPETAMPGWRWAWSAEIDRFPAAVLSERHPETVNLGDVSADDFTERAGAIARPNVLVFGSPCQSYSVAGKRLGLDDPRGNLALVALGIVDRLKPDWFVFENVPGLLSSAQGRDFGLLLRTVDELGYSLAWTVLDAQHFGVAQRRQRVFAVGHLGDWRHPAAVLFEPESLCGHSAPRRETRANIAGTIGSGSPRCGQRVGADEAAAGQLVSMPLKAKHNSSHDDSHDTYIAHALNAKGGGGRIDGESETFVTHALRADGFDASEDGTRRGTPIVAFQCHGTNVGEMGTLRRGDGGVTSGVPFAVALRGREGGGTAECSELPSALRASTGGGDKAHVLTSAVRRLMPVECERLQGFPDDYTAVTYRKKPAADGPRYKALGNSMAVPVMRWILSRIEHLSISSTSLKK